MDLDRNDIKKMIRESLKEAAVSTQEVDEGFFSKAAEMIPGTSAHKMKKAVGDSVEDEKFTSKGVGSALVNKLVKKIKMNSQLNGFITDLKAEPGSDKALVAAAAMLTMLGVGDVRKAYQKIARFQLMQQVEKK